MKRPNDGLLLEEEEPVRRFKAHGDRRPKKTVTVSKTARSTKTAYPSILLRMDWLRSDDNEEESIGFMSMPTPRTNQREEENRDSTEHCAE